MKSRLQDNKIEMYSKHNVGKSVFADRFNRTLKTKKHKYMATVSKYIYIGKLDDKVNKCNNTYHRKIKIKSVDVKDNTDNDNFDLKKVKNTVPWTYVINNRNGEKIIETFYQKEI